jgi:hypothetical protein
MPNEKGERKGKRSDCEFDLAPAPNKEVGPVFWISDKTARNHVDSIIGKLEASEPHRSRDDCHAPMARVIFGLMQRVTGCRIVFILRGL